mmetsp:Transcript_33093/g.79063  ORF Transcript_33093/g.79063 Transcript_33093/m.79063 type:complete len:95 (+) Transcript_33093:1899-2183(+)
MRVPEVWFVEKLEFGRIDVDHLMTSPLERIDEILGDPWVQHSGRSFDACASRQQSNVQAFDGERRMVERECRLNRLETHPSTPQSLTRCHHVAR